MQLDLVKPCDNCPFRTDYNFPLRYGRVRDILHSITEEDATFACHKTTGGSDADQQHCAGAAILLERIGRPNQWMRIMERFKLYDYRKLDMDAPVFGSCEEMLAAGHWARKAMSENEQ